MQKFLDLVNKYSPMILAIATAYWAVVAIIGDVILMILPYSLYFIARILYLAVGLVGVLKVIEIFKPDLLASTKKSKK